MIQFITNRTDQLVKSINTIVTNEPTVPDNLSNVVGIDLETTGLDFIRNEILLLIIGDKDNQYVYDWTSWDELVRISFILELTKKYTQFIGHNLGFDLPFLMRRCGSDIFDNCDIYDTMVSEQILIKGTTKSASLDATLQRRLKIEPLSKHIRMEFTLMSNTTPFFDDRHIRYAAEDVQYLESLKEIQQNLIRKFGSNELAYYNNNCVKVTSKMKSDGIKINVGYWTELYKQNLNQVDILEQQLDEELLKLGYKQKRPRFKQRNIQTDIFGKNDTIVENKNINNVNYGSPKQIIEIFKQLKQPVPKTTKEDKDSIGEATLQQYLIDRPNTPLKSFIELLINYKDVSKKANTFGKEWLEKFVDEEGFVHGSLKVNTTATGRFASTQPNLQQIPADNRYRNCFISRFDGGKIWTADYSGAELKILASLSNDEVMIDLIKNDKDAHGYAATPVYRYLYKDDSAIVDKNNHKDFRAKMKNVIFGLLYGAGVSKIAELLDISKVRAEKVYEIIGETFPDVFKYLDNVSEFGISNGYIVFEDQWKQRRWFEEVKSQPWLSSSDKSKIERFCKNTPIQGINAQMIKVALTNIDDYIVENNLNSMIVLTVHDEIVVDVHPDEFGHTEKFKEIMKSSADMFLKGGIEMVVDDKLDNYWSK
jgi:DNA polymerase I-like protein with 3'-5' exonuclease and polymerase domains